MERKTENEKKKEYLWRYQNAKRKEAEINEEIMQLRIDKMVPSLVQDGMPHGSGGGDLSGYAARLDELMCELYEQMEQCIAIRLEISRKIEGMQDETESLLLRYRYIQGLKWEDIAVKMEYSWKQIHRIHGKALNNFKMT
ncbi:MAG: hypothetical protein ACLVEV_03875 [Lachnospiraceae bacterium]